MNRRPMSDFDWFEGELAIADVVWVEGIGLCSHQPDLRAVYPAGLNRMMDEQGRFHLISGDQMFQATREEIMNYWRQCEYA